MDDPIQFPKALVKQIIHDRMRWANPAQLATILNVFYPNAASMALHLTDEEGEIYEAVCVYPGAVEQLLLAIPE